MTGYFEVISASSSHIYHSALVLAPKRSIVWELYGSQAAPFARVVYGALISWDMHTAATRRHSTINLAVRSPCDRFIAVIYQDTTVVDILDSATLQKLQTLKSPDHIPAHRGLTFSLDSHILTYSTVGHSKSRLGQDQLLIVSWDLQTGGIASVISQPWMPDLPGVYGKPSIMHLANGKMVGICYQVQSQNCHSSDINISIFDVASGVCTHSHLFGVHIWSWDHYMWTEGESLRFATTSVEGVVIWEVELTPGTPPTKVETLSLLGIQSNIRGRPLEVQFSPTSRRLACTFNDSVLVWDFQSSKYLLLWADTHTKFNERMFFSSHGYSLACLTVGSEIYLWRDSPTGFILYGILAPGIGYSNLLLSKNGDSIVMYGDRMIQLWHNTKGFPTTPPSVSTQAPQPIECRFLDISPDSRLAVVATRNDNMVTVLNLNSSVLQSTIDTGMPVYGLWVIKNTTVVIGRSKVRAWNLPIGDGVPGARVGLKGCSWTTPLSKPEGIYSHSVPRSTSISPDSHHIAIITGWSLIIYHAFTGECLATTSTAGATVWFSLDGLKVWCAQGSGKAEVRRFRGWGDRSSVIQPMKGLCGWRDRDPVIWPVELRIDIVNIEHASEGCPWGSSQGYQVTDDWWILSPNGKRLLMLPPPW